MTRDPARPADEVSDEHFAWLVDTVFAPPVTATGADHWYWDDVSGMEPEALGLSNAGAVKFTRRLWEAPEMLAERFDPPRIDQGFEMLYSGWGMILFIYSLYDAHVPWSERRAAIAAIPTLYERLFIPLQEGSADHAMGTPFMLTDFLASPFQCGNASAKEYDSRRVQHALLHAFRRLLRMPQRTAQDAAVHGIFHLQHPRGPALVRRWLRRTDIEPPLREYAEKAVERGEVL